MKFLNYCKLIAFCVLTLTFASCQDDNDIFDAIAGETWVGDLGFVDSYGHYLESGVTFYGDGTGYDEQYCYDEGVDGVLVEEYDFTWIIANNVLTLNYKRNPGHGGVPQLVIKDVYIIEDELHGILYADGKREGEVILYRF